MMNLKGVLDFSLGNFLCLRGFAPMGTLYDLSEPDASIQRDLLREHRDEMVAFLSQGEFLFFPEVILCTTLCHDGDENDNVSHLIGKVRNGESFANLKFEDYRVSSSAHRTKSDNDSRIYDTFQTATVELNTRRRFKFSRIDGNHRLSAIPEDEKFRKHNTPFCLIFFRNQTEAARFSSALFHNINYKQIPLTMEQNLKLILDDPDLFPDEKLKTHASFGWSYYLARQLNNRLDFDLIPNLKPFIYKEPRTFLVRQFTFLTEKKVLGDNENAIKRFKAALAKTNSLFDEHHSLSESKNNGLLAALVYYQLKSPQSVASFVKWVLENHLHLIKDTNTADFIQIFDKVLYSRERTIFVSMPFDREVTENHYKIIESVCDQINKDYDLKPALKVQRVDWFHDGTSYVINDKIIEMMGDCGLLIGNLTYCNLNVYNEIGFIMGKAKAEGKAAADMLLFLDESVAEAKDKFVGFNLQGIKQLRFTQSEKFKIILRENIERFFKL